MALKLALISLSLWLRQGPNAHFTDEKTGSWTERLTNDSSPFSGRDWFQNPSVCIIIHLNKPWVFVPHKNNGVDVYTPWRPCLG